MFTAAWTRAGGAAALDDDVDGALYDTGTSTYGTLEGPATGSAIQELTVPDR